MKVVDVDSIPRIRHFYPITDGLCEGEPPQWGDHLKCPICDVMTDVPYTHLGEPILLASDQYKAWSGRGSLLAIPVRGECGHRWYICIGYHKGQNYIFLGSEDERARDW